MTPSAAMRQWLLDAAQDARATPAERDLLTSAADGTASLDDYRRAIWLATEPGGIYGRPNA